tara:strand:- start:3728 stop:4513 length:786 start_codon:yes stop_codon:yes gene_type:complete
MKAIILAAGKGTRLQKYTFEKPKGMLKFGGKSLIDHQIAVLRHVGIIDITIVVGYKKEHINISGIKTYTNPDFSDTNMVESLFCALPELSNDVLVLYGDIIYEPRLIQNIILSNANISVAVDTDWKKYWIQRYDTVLYDLETLQINEKGLISELGNETTEIDKIDARYIGIVKFSNVGIEILKQCYERNKKIYWNKTWQKSKNTFQNAYMTDMLQQLLDDGNKIFASKQERGWLEFDTNQDYERMKNLLDTGQLNSIIKLI